MIPIKSKKNLESTIEEIRKFSFSYLEKYAPSRQQLRTYLLKKFLKSPCSYVAKSELLTLIDLVIFDLEKHKFISDKFYSQSKTKKFLKKGYSLNKIRNYLINKGINENMIGKNIELIKIILTLEFGKKINVNQKGNTPKLSQR